MPGIELGLERCLTDPPERLRRGRFGLLMNQASVDWDMNLACDLLADRFPGQLQSLFSPQHGLWGEQQANMVESADGWYSPRDLPVFSLYSHRRRPVAHQLQNLDCLVIDLPDVGTRVYTFAWTVLECLRACAEAGVRVLVLDRPNPLGGVTAEGPLLRPGFRSFVGGAEIPLRHGLTLGELARLLNAEESIRADLQVVPVSGWRREMMWPETGRDWVPPSPNLPRFESAVLYPGMVLLEGTNVSEGRGTTRPFEIVGAPFLDPWQVAENLRQRTAAGLRIRPLWFVPTFDKHRGARCGGVALHPRQAAEVTSITLAVAFLVTARRLAREQFTWLPPPYEYETQKLPIDILWGSSQLREAVDAEGLERWDDLQQLTALDNGAWQQRIRPHLLY